MLRFVLRKMTSKKWMVFALLIGNMLLVSITCSNAMYGKAMLQRTLMQEMNAYLEENNAWPGHIYIKAGGLISKNPLVSEAAQLAREIPQIIGIPGREIVEYYSVGPSAVQPELDREDGMVQAVALGMLSGIEEHVSLVAGRMYSDEPAEDGAIEVIVSERGMMEMNLLMGECFTMKNYKDEGGAPLRLRVCGVFRNSSEEDVYWVRTPSYYQRVCLMSGEIFKRLFIEDNTTVQLEAQFDVLLDYTAMRAERAEEMLSASEALADRFYKLSWQPF